MFERVPGPGRYYRNTVTGEVITRRQYDKIARGINYEKKAAENKLKDLSKAVARPARGRTKARTETEIEFRLRAAEEHQEQKRTRQLQRKAGSRAKKTKVKVIRPQLLKTGKRAERVDFTEYSEYADYIEQMNRVKAPNGKRLITSYGIGIVGFDERTGAVLGATLVPLQSPRVKLTEDELAEITNDFLESKLYFIFSHWYLHLHFDTEYAEARFEKARRKNIPKRYR